jgi:hypothetical protein
LNVLFSYAGTIGNIGTAFTGNTISIGGVDLVANAAAQANQITGANVNIQALSANLGGYYTYANTQIQNLSANLGATQIWANANIASINANLGGYYTYANTVIQSINANLGATQIWANANIASINANIGSYFFWNNANAAGKTQFDMPVAFFSGNRWGIDGSHALPNSGGLKAIFKLESEYEVLTGNMDTPGVLFNRDAWLGIQSESLGKITLGRQNTLAREFSKTYGDAYGPAAVNLEEGGYTNNNNFKQFIYYSGSATGTRYDKGIVWKKQFGDIVAGGGYQIGGVPGDTTTGTT